MAKEEMKEGKAAAMAAALAKANKEAGYDIALAYSTLNSLRVNEQLRMDIPLADVQTDVLAIADIVNRATGGVIDGNALALLMEVCIAYGWHWCNMGESLLRSGDVEAKILGFVDRNDKVPITEKAERKKAIYKGYEALKGAIERASSRLRLQRAVKS